jgi:hypothetical protein
MVTWRRPLAEINFLGLEFSRRISIPRISTGGSHYTVSRGIGMPKIPTEYLDCIFYCYQTVEDAEAGSEFGGSGFLVSVASPAFPEHLIYTYAVTNWHNVAHKAGASVIRFNRRDGSHGVLDFGPEDWSFSPKYDIAALRIHFDPDENRGVFVPIEIGVSPGDIEPKLHSIGVGDEVFMLGRFVDHDGGPTNQPAARFGNISVLPAPVKQSNGQFADSFCLDLHSRTGFSGSPVFVYRTVGGDLDAIAAMKPPDPFAGRGFLKFLGIHWGQFPEEWETRGPDDVVGQYFKGVSGMTLALPAWSVREVLDLPIFRAQREREDKEAALYFRQHGLPANAENKKKSMHFPHLADE